MPEHFFWWKNRFYVWSAVVISRPGSAALGNIQLYQTQLLRKFCLSRRLLANSRSEKLCLSNDETLPPNINIKRLWAFSLVATITTSRKSEFASRTNEHKSTKNSFSNVSLQLLCRRKILNIKSTNNELLAMNCTTRNSTTPCH